MEERQAEGKIQESAVKFCWVVNAQQVNGYQAACDV